MEIIDQRFGAEIVTLKGKNYKFDSGECMANYLRQEKIKNTDVKSLWVINAAKPKQLIDGAKAFYLHSENFPSPMGGNLSAFETQDELLKFKQLYNGDEWNWNDVMQKVR
jgi:copper chaperone NosL